MTICRNNYKSIYKKAEIQKESDNKKKEIIFKYFFRLYYPPQSLVFPHDIKPTT